MINDSFINKKFTHTRRSSASESLNSSLRHLEQIKDIHSKAKALRVNSIKHSFPTPIPLEKNLINNVTLVDEQIRVPIMVPQSMIYKSSKSKPPRINHVTKTGEVLNIHLLSESVPIFDPLIKAEAKISKKLLGKSEVLADINIKYSHMRMLKSVSPVKNRSQVYELTPPEGLHVIRENTPKAKVERYNFRENDVEENVSESNRTWVSKRMQCYSKQIKELFRPHVSLKKQIELELIKERLKKDKPLNNKRVKLMVIKE